MALSPDERDEQARALATIMAVAAPESNTHLEEYGKKGSEVYFRQLNELKGPRFKGPPLVSGSDRQAIGHNIKMMLAYGVPHRQAIATALAKAEGVADAVDNGGMMSLPEGSTDVQGRSLEEMFK